MIYGIGTDILAVSRIQSLGNGLDDPFITSVFTLNEIKESDGKGDRWAYFAGRFAAKEAVYKCLRLSGDANFREIEVLGTGSGAPSVGLYGALLEYANKQSIDQIHLSISHETAYAVAYAIATMEAPK